MTFGFIITRHVSSEEHNRLWQTSVKHIRKYYTDPIVIIDDNSKQEFVKGELPENTKVIQSEFPGAGEILGYYYMLKYKLFDKAVIFHDSIFVNCYIDFQNFEDYKFLWYFNRFRHIEGIIETLQRLKNHHRLMETFHKDTWLGCFGIMSMIELSFLQRINEEFGLLEDNFVSQIKLRSDRHPIERVFGIVCHTLKNTEGALCNDIFQQTQFMTEKYDEHYLQHKLDHLRLIKVWTGR